MMFFNPLHTSFVFLVRLYWFVFISSYMPVTPAMVCNFRGAVGVE